MTGEIAALRGQVAHLEAINEANIGHVSRLGAIALQPKPPPTPVPSRMRGTELGDI
ncbi:MAG: hypothetical protein AAF567_19020 [Actinomycetota bacterium]